MFLRMCATVRKANILQRKKMYDKFIDLECERNSQVQEKKGYWLCCTSEKY